MRIGEVAQASKVSVRSLRYYEEQGLLESTRSPSGQREYGVEALDRVALIQQLFAAGLTSKSLRSIIPAVQAGRCDASLVSELGGHRSLIRDRIDQLEAAAQELDRLIGIAERYDRRARGQAA